MTYTQEQMKDAYMRIKDGAMRLSGARISDILDEYKGMNLADAEYTVLGGKNRTAFYELLYAFKYAVSDAKGDTKRINCLQKAFRRCYELLYKGGLRPDAETLAEWTILGSGRIKHPKKLHIKDKGAFFNGMINDTNAPYPFYMPYQEWDPVSRLMFDEFVRYCKFSYNNFNLIQLKENYHYNDRVAEIAENMRNLPDDDIVLKAELDQLNIKIAQRYDYLVKSLVAIDPLNFNTKTEFDKAPYFKIPTKVESDAVIRLGMALTSPSCMKKYERLYHRTEYGVFSITDDVIKKLSDELIADGEEYYSYKYSLFDRVNGGFKLKSNKIIAQLPFPSYISQLTSKDIVSEYDYKTREWFVGTRHHIWADKREPNFSWLPLVKEGVTLEWITSRASKKNNKTEEIDFFEIN